MGSSEPEISNLLYSHNLESPKRSNLSKKMSVFLEAKLKTDKSYTAYDVYSLN